MTVNNLTLNSGNSSTIAGNIDITDLITDADLGTMTMTGASNTFANEISFNAATAVVLGDNLGENTFNFNGGLTLDGGTASVGADITSSGDVIDFAGGQVTLITDSTIDSTIAAGNPDGADVSFAGLLTDAGNTFDLAIDAGNSGAISFAAVNIADLTISDADTVVAAGNLTLNAFKTEVQPYSVTMQGAANTFTQAIDFTNTGLVTLGVGGGDTFDFDGGLSFSQNAPSAINGTIRTDGEFIDFGSGGVFVAGNSSVVTNNGVAAGEAIDFGANVFGAANDLTLDAGTDGAITFSGADAAGAVTLQHQHH